ncbi:MAG TPA: alpha/beta hydrolase [Ilumatobacteraceae bacterium]
MLTSPSHITSTPNAPAQDTPAQTTPAQTTPAHDTSMPKTSRDPVWRVVGGSLAAGFVAALVLTLGVFGGAPEPVITGCALLAFAGGWALLALLTARFTSHSQRWAWAPAAVMAAAGLTLVTTQPGDGALDAAGWVWPPIMVFLAVWMFVRVRRGFAGRVRWLLYPVVLSLAIASVGAMFETAMRGHDDSTYAAPGTLYDVGGQRLHLSCTGTGRPTVVLESGLGGMSASWARIVGDVNPTTRVCAYDRAGQGWSDDVDEPQDAAATATDLHTLLQRAGEAGPFVLVGHSAGGPYVMTYAARYPDEVAGMVLLDAMSPDEFSDLPGFASEHSMVRRGLGVLPSVARLGVARVLPTSMWSSLPEPAASQVAAFSASARGMRNMRDEQSMYPVVFEQAKALTSLGDTPLVVVTATESIDQHAEWTDLQARLAALSTDSDRRIADATHAGLLDDAASARISSQAIADVVDAIRTGAPLTSVST